MRERRDGAWRPTSSRGTMTAFRTFVSSAAYSTTHGTHVSSDPTHQAGATPTLVMLVSRLSLGS